MREQPEHEPDRVAIGKRLRLIRKQLKMRQVDLAAATKSAQGFVADVERGAYLPGAQMLAGIERLGYSPNWLISGEGTMQPTMSALSIAATKSGLPLPFTPPATIPSGRVSRPYPGLIGSSKAIFDLVTDSVRAALTGQGVLFIGEPGTGVEMAVYGLNEYSIRYSKPFLAVDCLTEKPGPVRIEAAVETARSGTLFLHGITELVPETLARLVELLPEFEGRLIGSSVRPNARTDARLPEQLHKRMPMTVVAPPLRERRQDLPLVADHLLRTFRRKQNREGLEFELAAWNYLLSRDYTVGNFRQVEWVIEHCLKPERLRVVPLATVLRVVAESNQVNYFRLHGGTFHAAERTLIEDALANHDHDMTETATALGIDRFFLHFLTIILRISTA